MANRRDDDDAVWKALADPTRRALLDQLRDGPRTTGALCAAFPTLTRFAVMKHLAVLALARLILAEREGRERWNHLNPAPIQRIHRRWVSRHVQPAAARLVRLKEHAERERRPAARPSD